jgi:hypothetical protein
LLGCAKAAACAGGEQGSVQPGSLFIHGVA